MHEHAARAREHDRRRCSDSRTGVKQRALMLLAILALAAFHGSATVSAQADFVSAKYVSGDLPVAPVLAVSGGEVFLEVLVAVDGRVDSIRTLRTTPGFTDAVIEAVRGWWFLPTTQAVEPSTGQISAVIKPVAAPVLVAAVFASPALIGPTAGQPPQDVLSASAETPWPTVASPAAYPPNALGGGAVLVEVTIDGAGGETDAHVKVSSPAFDAAALEAAKLWPFRAARRRGKAVTTHAYLLFAFQQPVIGR